MRTADRSFTDPRLADRLGKKFFPSTCQLQLAIQDQNNVGEEVDTWETKYTAACRFSAGQLVQANSRQTTSSVTTIFATHQAILVGSFADVRPDTWRAVIDGVIYDIKSVDWAEGLFTQLAMNQQSPVAVNA
jgi:hypothetical protein